jgi:hypothetical protein
MEFELFATSSLSRVKRRAGEPPVRAQMNARAPGRRPEERGGDGADLQRMCAIVINAGTNNQPHGFSCAITPENNGVSDTFWCNDQRTSSAGRRRYEPSGSIN